MKTRVTFLVLITFISLVGCAKKVRSISQSGYHDSYAGAPLRELDEFDVLGLDRTQPVTEEDIRLAASQTRRVRVAAGDTILLIQSGAIFPDGVMVTELSKHFRVVPFTGMAIEKKADAQSPSASERHTRNAVILTDPDKPASVIPLSTLASDTYRSDGVKSDPGDYSRLLRLAAARAGASTVVCYWGILESGDEQIATKTVSWLPVLNWVVPDERQHMRIRLKIALIDVPSGTWSVLSAKPLEGQKWSVRTRREVADQRQIESLKTKAYELAARDLVNAFAVR